MSDESYLRYFPYEKPYEHQREAMARVSEALSDGNHILFEGATGTGKTLASLTPALEYARNTDKTVVITTNVHQQMRQFRRDASAIADTEDIRAVVFRGKSSMCHIDVGYEECQALRDTTRDLVDTEQDLAELEQKQAELLDATQHDSDTVDKGHNTTDTAGKGHNTTDTAGKGHTQTDNAVEARNAIMDELDDVEAELAEFEEQATCDHYYRNLTAGTTEFFAWLYDDVRTPDEIYDFAHERGFCGYELLKEGMEGVDLVVCNYHHLLDPMIREQFFRWLGRDPEDVVAIFDEAHNIENAARDHARRTLTETTVESALDELDGVDDRRSDGAYNVLSTFLRAMRDTYSDALDDSNYNSDTPSRSDVDDNWTDISIAHSDRRDDLTLSFFRSYTGPGYEQELQQAIELGNELDTQYEKAYKNGETSVRKECQILQAATFLESWLEDSDATGTYPVVSVRREKRQVSDTSDQSEAAETTVQTAATNDNTHATGTDSSLNAHQTGEGQLESGPQSSTAIYGRAELYTCIPEQVTQSLFGDLHASVLMSATLRPFAVTEDVLGLEDPETMAYGPQFPESRRRTYTVDGPALFASKRDDPSVQETVTSVLEDTVRMTPGNTLAFFPSYAEAQRYHDRVTVGTQYLDESGTAAHELRERFTDDDDGVLFTSLWGTLGEGVSYDGDDARTVVVVGVPYPHLDDRMEAVQQAYDTAFGDRDTDDAGWRYAVEIPTIRKTRQALGRVVRSPSDFGARILLDARYTERAEIEMPEYAVRGTFPAEERAEMIDVEPEKLKFGLLNFYNDMDAYDGNPPAP